MKYDFTTVMDRQGKDSIAADVIPVPGAEVKEGFRKIPMWVADMNFPTAPSVIKAMEARISHPAFGYFELPDAYFESIQKWQEVRHGVKKIERKDIGYENGVLGGVVAAAQAFCSPGDSILLHAPTYIGFTMSLSNNGYKLVHSHLKQDGQGVWRMDYADMDRKLKKHHIHFAVFCSPHNPTGRVWEKEEIEKAMEIYAANDCVVVSDEIWSDLILDGNTHIPTQSVSMDARKRTIAFYAPSKTFSLAGLVGAYHIVYDAYLRDRLLKQSSLAHYNEPNVVSVHALIGAYQEEGQEWVDELCQVLSKNVSYACEYIREHFDGVKLAEPQGTYMLYLDCEAWCEAHGKTLDELLKAGIAAGVIWQDGRPFHRPYAIRMNLAVPFALVKEAMERLREWVF